jgi:phosphoserine aminotransferase
MIYFYPGPSKLYPEVRQYLTDAYDSGILSMNHRSAEFVELSKSTIYLLKEKLQIPQDYTIFFVSSATESWEIVAQSLITKGSLHIFNGAFGQKWHEYTLKIHQEANVISFGENEIFNTNLLPNPLLSDIICFTHNETSNGTQILPNTLATTAQKFPDKLIALDATSSLGGINIDWQYIDLAMASVQKCFGLPAGLGLMICSPKAIAKALLIGERKRYNSLVFLYENMKNWQTNYTPNVLNIYLLKRVLENRPPIAQTHHLLQERANLWYNFLEKNGFDLLIKNSPVRSDTVIAIKGQEKYIKELKEKAKKQGIILGNGYGEWKENTIRIANFPAIDLYEIQALQDFLQENQLSV